MTFTMATMSTSDRHAEIKGRYIFQYISYTLKWTYAHTCIGAPGSYVIPGGLLECDFLLLSSIS